MSTGDGRDALFGESPATERRGGGAAWHRDLNVWLASQPELAGADHAAQVTAWLDARRAAVRLALVSDERAPLGLPWTADFNVWIAGRPDLAAEDVATQMLAWLEARPDDGPRSLDSTTA